MDDSVLGAIFDSLDVAMDIMTMAVDAIGRAFEAIAFVARAGYRYICMQLYPDCEHRRVWRYDAETIEDGVRWYDWYDFRSDWPVGWKFSISGRISSFGILAPRIRYVKDGSDGIAIAIFRKGARIPSNGSQATLYGQPFASTVRSRTGSNVIILCVYPNAKEGNRK